MRTRSDATPAMDGVRAPGAGPTLYASAEARAFLGRLAICRRFFCISANAAAATRDRYPSEAPVSGGLFFPAGGHNSVHSWANLPDDAPRPHVFARPSHGEEPCGRWQRHPRLACLLSRPRVHLFNHRGAPPKQTSPAGNSATQVLASKARRASGPRHSRLLHSGIETPNSRLLRSRMWPHPNAPTARCNCSSFLEAKPNCKRAAIVL